MRLAVILCACVAGGVATTAASALAATPEIGRCEAQAGGKFTSTGCNEKAKGSAPKVAEFHKGAAAHLSFRASSGTGTFLGAGLSYVCTASRATGVYREVNGRIDSVEHVVWTFTGCGVPAFGIRCSSSGHTEAEETIVYDELKGKLGYLTGEKTTSPTLGLQLEPADGKAFAEFDCGGGSVSYRIESVAGHNCVISELTPPNTMSTTISQVFETVGSTLEQKWTHFEKTPTKSCQLEQSLNGGARQLTGQQLNATVTSELPLEAHG